MWRLTGLVTFLVTLRVVAFAQLEVVPDKEAKYVFPGNQSIEVVLRNHGEKAVRSMMSGRLYQASSGLTVLVNETPGKELHILPGQTVIESMTWSLSEVKADTRFFLQWIDNTNKVMGRTEVFVCPKTILKELKLLCDGERLGVLDPQGKLKPVLAQAGVDVFDLQEEGFESFTGRLAILGPFSSKAEMSAALPTEVRKLSEKGVATVWIQPPMESHAKLTPSFYSVSGNKAAVIIAQAELLSQLGENPRAQLNLVELARLASRRTDQAFPNLVDQN